MGRAGGRRGRTGRGTTGGRAHCEPGAVASSADARLSLGAALLSAGYLHHYLRGGPRIIDATSYFLEARALSEGYFAFPVPDPSGSFRGRFLLTPPEATTLTVLFPPGYPALLLALGFWWAHPWRWAPSWQRALTWVTARAGARTVRQSRCRSLAATLSVLCAALRYHTADTMSHGWAAMLLSRSAARSAEGEALTLVGAGLALGMLVATRPVSGRHGRTVRRALVPAPTASRGSCCWRLGSARRGAARLAPARRYRVVARLDPASVLRPRRRPPGLLSLWIRQGHRLCVRARRLRARAACPGP